MSAAPRVEPRSEVILQAAFLPGAGDAPWIALGPAGRMTPVPELRPRAGTPLSALAAFGGLAASFYGTAGDLGFAGAPGPVSEALAPSWPEAARPIPLPAGPAEAAGTGDAASDVVVLADVLRTALGPIERIRRGPLPAYRRTSPSAGAAQTTEVVVCLPRRIAAVPSGTYGYDAEAHALVPLDAPPYRSLRLSGAERPAFLVCAVPARLMARYPEPHSFRALLYDAGHLVETLLLLLAHYGLRAEIALPPPPPRDVPEYGLIELAVVGEPGLQLERAELAATPSDGRVDFNPLLYLRTTRRGLAARVPWPESQALDLAAAQVRLLSRCAWGAAADGALGSLRGTGVVLPRAVAARAAAGARSWGARGWYLPLLVHAEVRAAAHRSEIRDRDVARRREPLAGRRLRQALLGRRTARAFAPEQISRRSLGAVLAALAGLDVEVVVAALDVEGLPPAFYRWEPASGRAEELAAAPSRAEIRWLTAGQEPAGNAPVAVWLVRRVRAERPRTWELELMELGRAGQRLALAACTSGLGVFLTHTICDAALFRRLGLGDAGQAASYFAAVGRPAAVGPDKSNRREAPPPTLG